MVDLTPKPAEWDADDERAVLAQTIDQAARTPGTDVASAAWGAARALNAMKERLSV